MAKRRRSDKPVGDRQKTMEKPAPGAWRLEPSTLLLLAVLGLAGRVGLALVSWGTGDVYTFYRFAVQVDHVGLLRAYQQDADLNHPPLPAYWAWTAYRLTRSNAAPTPAQAAGNAADPEHRPEASSSSDEWFSFVLKLPVILA